MWRSPLATEWRSPLVTSCRRTISEAKRQSWRAYVSTLNNNTSAKHTWQMLRRISGKRKEKTIKYLVTDSDTITNKTDIAETLATSFAANRHQINIRKNFERLGTRRRRTHWTLSQIMTKSTMLISLNEN